MCVDYPGIHLRWCYNLADMFKQRCLAALLAVMLLVGCTGQGAGSTPSPGSDGTPTFTPTTAPRTPTPSPSSVENLVLWVVPRFAPSSNSAAGDLLLARLQAFEEDHPGLTITTRIKQESGTGGMLETLEAASIASPASLPDIVTLDAHMIDMAALDGSILILDDLLETPSAPTWYDFSLSASMADGGHYGMPFAADGDILAYSIAEYAAAPRSWSDILDGPAYFYFPSGDPRATFTVNQYLALDTTVTDTAGDPILEIEPLTEVLTFYESLHNAGMLPLISRNYTTASETWSLLSNGQAASALAPLSTFFDEYSSILTSAIPLPARTSAGSIFVETWSWAVVPRDSAREALAIELLQWLCDPEFLGPWTDALNMLPSNAPTLATWPDGSKASIASRLVTNARIKIDDAILDILGPPLYDAIGQVLLNLATPEEAAAAVVEILRSR
jgi:ABC-type glycerol-3-phosphate transport system substrate-binding protein